jgi:hypothetical protein
MKFLPTHLRFSAVALIGLLASCDQLPPAISLESEAAEPAGIPLPAEVSFNEHIQPILSEYCYHCHGPDAGTREPKDDPLRLDLAENAFALRESLGRAAITKGDAKASKILELMRSADPDVIMPPPESHKKMQPREIALIERWIEQGAEYQAHWAFAPIKRPSVPEAGAEWSKHPIDRFTFEKMAEAGFKPNPPDDPHRFHRRLSFDTTGLPPQPDETAAFVKSYQENPEVAVAAEADRLLATTASAEHFTRHWLDAARYADTHGITSTTTARSGPTATGSSAPSKRTCRGINSPPNKSPAICCRTGPSTNTSPPASTAASPPPARAARSPRNMMRFTPWIAWTPPPPRGSA